MRTSVAARRDSKLNLCHSHEDDNRNLFYIERNPCFFNTEFVEKSSSIYAFS